jgi:hypothetical protein
VTERQSRYSEAVEERGIYKSMTCRTDQDHISTTCDIGEGMLGEIFMKVPVAKVGRSMEEADFV